MSDTLFSMAKDSTSLELKIGSMREWGLGLTVLSP